MSFQSSPKRSSDSQVNKPNSAFQRAPSGGGSIFKYTPAGVGSILVGFDPNGAMGLAIDSAGNIYAANYGGDSICKFPPNGVGMLWTSTAGGSPIGLAVQPVPEPSGPVVLCVCVLLCRVLRSRTGRKAH